MFYNLKIAIRNLRRNGIYSVINIAGLAVSLAAVIIIALWVENELTFNRWYKKSERLYVTGSYSGSYTSLRSSDSFIKSLQTEFPEVKRVSHFEDTDVTLYAWEDDMGGYNDVGAYVDSTIFEMLDVKLVRGFAKSALQSLFSIVLSESLAKKFSERTTPRAKRYVWTITRNRIRLPAFSRNSPKTVLSGFNG